MLKDKRSENRVTLEQFNIIGFYYYNKQSSTPTHVGKNHHTKGLFTSIPITSCNLQVAYQYASKNTLGGQHDGTESNVLMLACHVMLLPVLTASLQIQLPSWGLQRAQQETHMLGPLAPRSRKTQMNSWLQVSNALAMVDIWGKNRQMEDTLILSLSLPLIIPFSPSLISNRFNKQINECFKNSMRKVCNHQSHTQKRNRC